MRRLKQKSMFLCFGGNQQKEFHYFLLTNVCQNVIFAILSKEAGLFPLFILYVFSVA